MLNINANRSAVGFGTVVEVKKVVVDGKETRQDWHLNSAVYSVVSILLKDKDSNVVTYNQEDGKKIRGKFAENVDDYIVPEQNISRQENSKNIVTAIMDRKSPENKPLLSYGRVNDKYVIGTEKEAITISKADFTRYGILDNHERERISDEEKDLQLENLNKVLAEKLNTPGSQLENNAKLVIYAKEIPEKEEFLKDFRGRDKAIQVTGIDFTA